MRMLTHDVSASIFWQKTGKMKEVTQERVDRGAILRHVEFTGRSNNLGIKFLKNRPGVV